MFAAEIRRKEIGVRKVLGTTALGISSLLSNEFLQLVLVAIVVAVPLSYIALQRWLQGFAYRVDAELITFVTAALASISIAVLTISFQSVKAARANPIDSLRYE